MAATNGSVRGGPSSPTSLVPDGVIAAAVAGLIVVGTFFASQRQPARRPFDAGAVALILIAAGTVAARRRNPVGALLVAFGATLAYFAVGYASGPIWLALIITFFTAVLTGHRLVAAIVAVGGFTIFPWLDYLLRDRAAPAFVSLAALAAWLLVLFGAAEAVRLRRERLREAARMDEEESLRRATEERLRIARELHDALGHHLSLISVQSGVALHVNEDLPAPARTSLVAIKQASKEALTELRSVLDILRQDGDPAPRSPTSTLARLDDLVTQASAAGLEVRTEIDGDARALPFGVDVAAFRIVQEALTNVTRHAGSASATVRIAYGDHDLTVQVDDDGRGSPTDGAPGGGKGIQGMRERVATLGGDLEVGPRPDGGFRVRARLPLEG